MKSCQLILLISFFFFQVTTVFSQTYHPVDEKSVVTFIIKNFGMRVDGKLSGLEGAIRFNAADLKNASFSVSMDANTVNTQIDVRDSSLGTAAYLNAQLFPKISFASKQITAGNKPGIFFVKGILTIKGISKEISFPFTVVPQKDGILLNGEFKIRRLDYKIGVNSTVLSEYLTVSLSVFAKKD